MDPHSRLSQYNQRPPKTRPRLSHTRTTEMKTPVVLHDTFAKRATSTTTMGRDKDLAALVLRPIATNSRVRRDESYRKDMYLAFVNNALQKKSQGNGEAFDELLSQFDPKRLSGGADSPPTQIRLWISALSHVVSQLDRPHTALVDAIVAMPWTTMDSAFVKSYVAFMGMLVSARPEYLMRVLHNATQCLTHQSGLQALNIAFPESSTSPLTRRIVYDRIHGLLQHLISLVPTLTTALQPILARHFPHKRQSHVSQITYIRNLLRVSEYCPELADRILTLVVDRTIQIDVEIQVELEELDGEGPPDSGEVFTLDLFDNVIGQDGDDSDSGSDSDGLNDDIDDLGDLSSDAGDVDSDAEQLDVPVNVQRVQDMVTKLDSILKVIFDHFSKTHAAITTTIIPPASPDRRSPPSEAHTPTSAVTIQQGRNMRRARFHTLLSIFDRTILRTFKSRYTQFLIFWYSSLDPEFTDLFQGFLVSKALLEESQPSVTRAAAASYIGSFVSRAQFVDHEKTRLVVRLLSQFLSSHLDLHDAGVASTQTSAQLTVFYAVTQALFLIFCFRWRDLLEGDDNDVDELGLTLAASKKWMPQLDVVQRVINSALNPLKVCSANVVQQFARISQHVGFVYCYSIMEANRRSEYAITSRAPSPGGRGTPDINNRGVSSMHPVLSGQTVDVDLTTFFPFDPYKLPKSSSYIQGVYREWSSVAIDDDDEQEEDGDGDEDSEEEDDLGAKLIPGMSYGAMSVSADGTGGLGESFGGMSISPARPRVLTRHEL